MINNSIVFANQKGGVGKTALVATLAAWAASIASVNNKGRVLAVDLDPQGSLAGRFGFASHDDKGESLAEALMDQVAPQPIEDVRPNLDVIAGGDYLNRTYLGLASDALNGSQNATHRLDMAIEMMPQKYDFVVMDSPPDVTGFAGRMALTSAAVLVIPVGVGCFDSITGLERLVNLAQDMAKQGANPNLTVGGYVVTNVDFAGENKPNVMVNECIEDAEEVIGDHSCPRLGVISRVPRAAKYAAETGQVFAELIETAEQLEKDKFKILESKGRVTAAGRLSKSASITRLAKEHAAVADEIFTIVTAKNRRGATG